MKLLLCRRCWDLVQMARDEVKACSCGNVKGKYDKDGITLLVKFEDYHDARIIGISNSFIAERDVPFSDPSYDNTLFQERKSHIVLLMPFTTGDVKDLKEDST